MQTGVLSRIKECEKLYKEEIVNKAESFVKDTDYSKAIEYLLDFVDQFDDSSEIEDKIAEYQDKELDNALKDAEDFISKGDYYSALESIAELEKDYPNNKKLEDLKKSTQESYLETVLPIIDDYMDKKDYGSAFSVCTNALEVIPDSEELIKRRDTIEPLKPVLLSEMKVSESEFFEQLTEHSATYEDVVGNTYDPGNLFRLHVYHDGWGNDEDGYAKIYLNSQYTTLEGVLSTDNTSDKGDCIVTILGDDKVLFKEKFNRSSSPKKVKVDVKGKQWLKIMICYPEVDSDASSSDNYGYKSEVLLSGFGFSK